MQRYLGLLGFMLLVACNSNTSGTIQIITGEETDTFTQTPVPTQIVVQAAEDDAGVITLATASYPTATIDLGNQDQNAVASLLVTASDDAGAELVYGASVPLQYGALDGETLPIFVQRVGQSARLPNPPADTRQSPTLGVLSDRFLIIGGGSDPDTWLTTQVYDFAEYNLLDPAPTLPYVPASMPIVGTIALVIEASGSASYYDFSEDTGTSVTAPTSANGFTFADVAGGQTIYDPDDGYVFVVGGTRTVGGASQAVLMIDTNDTSNSSYETGNLSWLTLTAPRLGASAAWLANKGLVVAGGNGGAMVAGVEVIDVTSNQTLGAELPYPPDGSSGSGMTALDQSEFVLLAGGITAAGADAGVRRIDLACELNCAPLAWGPNSGALPVPITLTSAFTFSATYAFAVGSEPTTSMTPGVTHAFTLTPAGATEVPTKVTHTNASAILSPMGSSILIYGGADEIESFTPAPAPP